MGERQSPNSVANPSLVHCRGWPDGPLMHTKPLGLRDMPAAPLSATTAKPTASSCCCARAAAACRAAGGGGGGGGGACCWCDAQQPPPLPPPAPPPRPLTSTSATSRSWMTSPAPSCTRCPR
jgi:hypothetical protein